MTKQGSVVWPLNSPGYTLSKNQYSSSTFSYDLNGRLTNDTFNTLGWDVNGNLLTQSGTNLVYDAFDRPVMASNTQYLYAPDGTLVASTTSGTTKVFVPLPMARAVLNGTTVDHYDRYDWQGTARVASTANQTVYSDTSYDAFGIPYESFGSVNDQYAGLNSDIFSGGEQVSSTRRYHPTQGRWISPDSIIPDIYNPQTFNAYHYALNQPTTVTDPSGDCDGDSCTLNMSDITVTLPATYPTFFEGQACSCLDFVGWYATLETFGLQPRYPWDPSWFQFGGPPPITTTLFPWPLLSIPANSGDPFLGIPAQPQQIFDPNQMSRSELNRLSNELALLDMTTKLGGAWASGFGAAFSAGPAIEPLEFPEVPAPAQNVALLRPYGGPGGGHHVPAQSAFEGAPGYDANGAPAIPNSELARLNMRHLKVITPAQRAGYIAFAKTGSPLTWDAVEKIETEALVKAGMNPSMAQNTVQQAIQQLKSMGVSQPTHIPWGGR